MRKFQYVEPLDGGAEPITITVSEEWIIRMYYPHWKNKMLKAGGLAYDVEECIKDFMTLHWAWEIK